MKTRKWFIILFLGILAVACGHQSGSAEFAPEPAMEEADYYGEADTKQAPSGGGRGIENQQLEEKKIIRTADMRMEVADYATALAEVKRLVQSFDGELIREEERQYGARLENQLTIKVKPERFDSILGRFEALAAYVDYKSINAEDVTRQYIDLETRLSSKRAVVARYRELLGQAKNVQEILEVEENLRKVVEEIESIEGQLRYLSRQVDFSTINLAIYEKSSNPIARRSFWSRVGDGFTDGWQLLKDLAVGLVSIWPILLILILGLGWFVRRRKKR